jgi:hypothetical protein
MGTGGIFFQEIHESQRAPTPALRVRVQQEEGRETRLPALVTSFPVLPFFLLPIPQPSSKGVCDFLFYFIFSLLARISLFFFLVSN